MNEPALVIDASIGIGLARQEPLAKEARRVITEHLAANGALLVPFLFWQEVVTVLARRYRYRGSAVLEAVYELDQLHLETRELGLPELITVVDLVERHWLSAYDATYLALTMRADARLLTADGALAAAAGRRAVSVSRRRSIQEPTEAYAATPDWPAWPGAAAYLRELRNRAAAGG